MNVRVDGVISQTQSRCANQLVKRNCKDNSSDFVISSSPHCTFSIYLQQTEQLTI